LAFSAWYYGGGSDISGGIAAADVLGIFGREGIGLASVSLPDEAPYVIAAFKAFLNYDGAGAHFGDTSVASSTNDVEGASVYASIESGAETQLVIVLMNKLNANRPTTINIDSATSYDTSLVYELTGEGATLVPAASLSASSGNTFSYEMPPVSLAVLVPQLAP
jgi:mannan endo-1,4-beta-mannosidase